MGAGPPCGAGRGLPAHRPSGADGFAREVGGGAGDFRFCGHRRRAPFQVLWRLLTSFLGTGCGGWVRRLCRACLQWLGRDSGEPSRVLHSPRPRPWAGKQGRCRLRAPPRGFRTPRASARAPRSPPRTGQVRTPRAGPAARGRDHLQAVRPLPRGPRHPRETVPARSVPRPGSRPG